MNLFFMRHAQPVAGDRMDATRGLTDVGKQQAADMGAWLAGHIGHVDIVIYSPFARCAETAQAMGKALGAHLADTRLLEPNGDPEDIWKEIERLAPQAGDVLVVGHHPSLNKLILWLMGGDGTQDDLKLEHAAIALVETADDDTGILCWLVTPEIVLANKDIVDAAESLTQSLTEAKTKGTVKKVAVAAFSTVLADGSFDDPEDVDEGDDLYMQRGSQPGAGSVSLADSGMAFGVALAAVAAGQTSSIGVSLNQKLWVTSDDPCPTCEDNADQGWIDADETFDSGDDEPPAHPNCECTLDTRATGEDEDVEESLRESLMPDGANVEQVVKMRMVSELEDGGTLVQLEAV